ncbi:MAG: hypothetical protein M1282_13475 [Chloroflexi bacterium]|nr:hypothetical protein [Chloroflexota bacterium]
MGLTRNVSLMTALRYKGQAPFLTYIMHRIGGSALFILFTLYILALAGVGSVHAVFGNWLFQIVFLFFGLFHAINGLRITILDLFTKLIEYQRQAITIEWAIFLLLYAYAAFVIVRNALGG